MKKITLLLGAAAMLTFASCKKEEKTTDETMSQDTTAVQTETPMPAEADTTSSPAKDTVSITKTGKSDETTVTAGKEGVTVKTENGSKTTEVKVSKDNGKVEVKK